MKNDYLKKFFLWAVFTALTISCSRKEEATTFADLCRNENQTEVSIKGFLKTPSTASNRHSQGFLLVENENGTGVLFKLKQLMKSIFQILRPSRLPARF
jgi:hypothetical protein